MAENKEPVSFLDLALVMKYIDPNMKLPEAQIWVSELKNCIFEMLNYDRSSIAFTNEEALSIGLHQPGTAKEKIQAVIDYEKSHPKAFKENFYYHSVYTSPYQIVKELLEAMKGNLKYWKDAKSSGDCDISVLSPEEELLAAQTFMLRNKHYNVSDEEALQAFHRAVRYLKGEECTSTEFIKCDSNELTEIIRCVNQHFTDESIDMLGFRIAKSVMDSINQGTETPEPDGYIFSWAVHLFSEVDSLRFIHLDEIFGKRSDDYIFPDWALMGQTCYRWYIFRAGVHEFVRKTFYAVQLKKTISLGGTAYEFRGDLRPSADLAILKRFQDAKLNGNCTTEFQGTSEYSWSREGKPPALPYFTVAQLYWAHYLRNLHFLHNKHLTDKEALDVCYKEVPSLHENKEQEKADPILKKTYTWFLNKPGDAVNDFPELKDYSEDQTFSDYLSPSTVPLQTDGFSYEWSREEHESTHRDFTLIFRARPTCERVPDVITEENRVRLDYWQYIKEFVFFGGSHHEGAVLAPDPAWIDEAHKNGVGIFGTVFLAPLNCGGDVNNINELAKAESLQKLMDIAHRLNFEGWFLNVESFLDYREPLLQDLKLSLKYMDLKGKQMIWYLPKCDQAKNFDPEKEGVTMTCDNKINDIAHAFKEESRRKLYLDFNELPFLTKTAEKYIMFADEPYWKSKLEDRGYLVKPDRLLYAQNCLWQLFLGQYGLQSIPAVWYGIAKYAMERKRLSKD